MYLSSSSSSPLNRDMDPVDRVIDYFSKHWVSCSLGGAFGLGVGFLANRYKVANANQVMVRTGLGINDINVCRSGIHWPFQKFKMVEMNPQAVQFELNYVSKEKVPFGLPISLVYKPYHPSENETLFKNYARTMIALTPFEIENTLKSVLTGEMRVLSAQRTIEEMFSEREVFKSCVTDVIQKVLDQFGLSLATANIEEMKDLPGNLYFEYRKRRAIENANADARVSVAAALKMGNIGESERKAETDQKLAELNAITLRVQNERALEIAKSLKDLEVQKAEYSKETEIAKLNAIKAKEIKEAELEQEVQRKTIEQQKETLRAKDLAKATVEAESAIAESKGKAEALVNCAKGESEAIERRAQAEALAKLAMYQAEAKGTELKGAAEAAAISAKYQAEADGLNQLFQSCNGNSDLIKFNLAVRSRLFPELAAENAKAVQGMNPKINIWGMDNAGGQKSLLDPVTNIVKSLPPLLDVLEQQTDLGQKISSLFQSTAEKKTENSNQKSQTSPAKSN